MTVDPATVSLEGRASGQEWQARVDLAACYRLVAHYGMTDLSFTHISGRILGQDGEFLLNPYGLMFEEVTASSLVKLDMDGTILDDGPYEINPAGYTIHSAVLAARADVSCVLHTHTNAGMAVSTQKDRLRPLTQTSLRFYEQLAYHDYEGAALDLDERDRLAADLGQERAMILRNHGLLTAGRTVPEAFVLIQRLESACQAQIAAQQSGVPLTEISPAVCEETRRRLERSNVTAGEREWPSLLRMLDRIDPSYRH